MTIVHEYRTDHIVSTVVLKRLHEGLEQKLAALPKWSRVIIINTKTKGSYQMRAFPFTVSSMPILNNR